MTKVSISYIFHFINECKCLQFSVCGFIKTAFSRFVTLTNSDLTVEETGRSKGWINLIRIKIQSCVLATWQHKLQRTRIGFGKLFAPSVVTPWHCSELKVTFWSYQLQVTGNKQTRWIMVSLCLTQTLSYKLQTGQETLEDVTFRQTSEEMRRPC